MPFFHGFRDFVPNSYLTGRSNGWRDSSGQEPCGLESDGNMPKNAALLEFARTEIFNFRAKGNEKKWLPAHYLAFILHAGNAEGVKMIDLGEADGMETAITQLKEQIGKPNYPEGATKASHEIYRRVFAPLRNELGNVKNVFVSPDGHLNLIPFEILQDPDGRYLIEDYSFNYLAAGRDIIGLGAPFFDFMSSLELEEKVSILEDLANRLLPENKYSR